MYCAGHGTNLSHSLDQVIPHRSAHLEAAPQDFAWLPLATTRTAQKIRFRFLVLAEFSHVQLDRYQQRECVICATIVAYALFYSIPWHSTFYHN